MTEDKVVTAERLVAADADAIFELIAAADINKDGVLSRQEFESALSGNTRHWH